MAKFLKKGSLGMLVEASGGASDSELTEIRLTPEEYFDLLGQIESAKQALREAEEHTSEAEARKNELENALAKQRSLNTNLKRIARERANAKRGLSPKKQRSGYVVLFSSQYRQRYKDPDGKKCIAYAWKSVLQTPFDATLPLDTIEDGIWNELVHRILFRLGFRRTQNADHNGEYMTLEEDNVELCVLYRWDYRANFRSGFWELTLYHTKDLIVPEEYRPSI